MRFVYPFSFFQVLLKITRIGFLTGIIVHFNTSFLDFVYFYVKDDFDKDVFFDAWLILRVVISFMKNVATVSPSNARV
jgi:hypothetical protein